MKFLLVLTASIYAAEPCSTGTPNCLDKLQMGDKGRFVSVYRSHPIDKGGKEFTRVLVSIHGAGRNADDYFPSAMGGAYLAGALANTLVVAPRFAGGGTANCKDPLSPGEIAFRCSGDNDWRGGGPGVDQPAVTTYGVIDELIRRFSDKKKYPNVKYIVLFGHSAGGQFLSRYAAASSAEPAGAAIRYVISNPSSYLYLDASRPGPVQSCPDYDKWKYGLNDRAGYAAAVPDERMKQNLVRRDVVYLLGEYDVTPQFGFDSSCGAMAQGPNRLKRGRDYHAYINSKYGAKHKLVPVPNCGHNGRCMLVANEARETLFP
ncbi:MAG: hypothetical protein FJW30_19245 [Acidobacteria bacterium]|nr:hypothetical protein [Acidobacteriota bacterium]